MNKKLCVAVLAVICSLSLLAGAKGFFKAEATTETKCLTSVSITLEKSITVNYFIENADNYTSAKMSFVYRNGQATKELPVGIVGGKAKVSFEGLAPQYMTDQIQATLTLYNGEEVAKTEENTFTVAGYVKDLLALDKEKGVSVEEYENMRALAVNLLYYGDEAQKYVAAENNEEVGTLASSVLTNDEKALKATTEPLTESEYSAPANNDGQKFRWVGYGARFDSMLGVYFEFIANTTENLVIKFNDGTETSYFEAYEKTVGENKITVYKAIKELFACDYAKTVTAEAYIGSEKVGSAITYGVKSLTADFESTTKEHALALNATIYGEAAAKYAKKHTCEFIDGAVETTEVLGTTTVGGYTGVATGLNVTGQKLAKICKFCGKVSDEGATATEIYDIDENVLSGGASMQVAGASANVLFALARAADRDFASGFTSKSGAKLTFGLYSDVAITATVVLKASSGYIVTDGGKWGGGEKGVHKTAKTENMQFNKVFSTALNGKAIAVGDEIKLYGDIATGGDNYKILGSFTYVPFDLELKAGYNELTFTADVLNNYKDGRDGDPSSPRVDSLAAYDGVKIVKSTCVNNGETHIYESLTGGENILEAHAYDKKVVKAEYLKTAADCTHNAVYYYSCACGAKGEETFELENSATGIHDYGDTLTSNNDGTHSGTCSVCGTKADGQPCSYVYTASEADGKQTLVGVCSVCGYGVTKTLEQTNANYHNVNASMLKGTNTIAWASGNYSTRTNAIIQSGSTSSNVQKAENASYNKDYVTYLYGGSRVEITLNVTRNTTASFVVKASSGWQQQINWGGNSSKTGDMVFNKIFKAYIRHADGTTSKIAVSDDMILKGASGGYEIMANWTYIALTGVAVKEGDTFVLESLTPKTEDGKYMYWDGKTQPKYVADNTVSTGNTQSSPTLDTIAVYY